MPPTHTTPLGNGNPMPLIGFGTYLIKDAQAEEIVATAISTGYRHIDTAEIYKNEVGVGKGIRAGLEENGLTREDLFVTTKLWPGNTSRGVSPRNYETALEACHASLERLGLDYVDLYLIHAPFNPKLRLETWRALTDLQAQGVCRAIGVSNYNQKHILEIQEAGLPLPAANQIELHPWSQKPDLVKFLWEHNILPIAYSSLIPLATWRAKPGQRSGKTEQMQADGAKKDSPFKRMAQKYGVSEAQVLLKWGLQKGYPILPKSEHPERIRQNFDLYSFTIDEGDMAEMEALDGGDGVAWGSGDPLKKR